MSNLFPTKTRLALLRDIANDQVLTDITEDDDVILLFPYAPTQWQDRVRVTARSVSDTVYISIGNSDDKLGQEQWADFYARTADAVQTFSVRVHGEWASLPNARWQNACWCFEPHPDDREVMREVLAKLARRFGQDSIAWAEATTEFIKSEG